MVEGRPASLKLAAPGLHRSGMPMTDDGVAIFIVFYSVDDDGKMAMVGRPFLYGRLSARNFEA